MYLSKNFNSLSIQVLLLVNFNVSSLAWPYVRKQLLWLYLIQMHFLPQPAEASSFCEWLTFCAGIACNASWVVVATCANAFTVLGQLGWKTVGQTAAQERTCLAVTVYIYIYMYCIYYIHLPAHVTRIYNIHTTNYNNMYTCFLPLEFLPL